MEVKPGAGSELKITPRKAARARGLQVSQSDTSGRETMTSTQLLGWLVGGRGQSVVGP